MTTRLISLLALIALTSACAPAKQQRDINLIELSIHQAQLAIEHKHITCEALIERYLKRIAAYDQTTQLNSIIRLNPHALQTARQLDIKFKTHGTMQALHCIPVILKDNFNTADMPTEAGSVAMRGSQPAKDAFIVQQLRAADAIIIAKSNMAEWAFSSYETISSNHGETRNAYDLSRVPAGSSGGTASAIAANFAIIGMGTDTGNSVRGPAAHLSLVGIRSTIGTSSRDGIVPLLSNRDIAGPLMRTVQDTALVLTQIAGYDPQDPVTWPLKEQRKIDYTQYLDLDGLKGARLGVLRQLYDNDNADFDVLDHMEQAITDLKQLGAIIIDPFEIAQFDELTQATGFCSRFRFDLNNYLRSLGKAAPIKSLDEVFAKNQFLENNKANMHWAMSVDVDPASQTPPCADVQGDPRRKQLFDAVIAAMDKHKLDAIIYPTWSNPPRKLNDHQTPHGNNSEKIAPHTGQPAITVPMGFTVNHLPSGLEFLARPFNEHKLFQFAYAYEQATKHRKPPVGFGPLK